VSKVAITGNASGTGVFTVASPNSNVDRVLTLPDESGTVLTTAGVPVSAISDGSITSAKLTGDAVPIGVDQTWQNMLASRAMATTYTNSTGKPIAVFIRINSGGTVSNTDLTIGGVVAWSNYNGVSQSIQPYGIVPAGATYSIVSGSSQNREFWAELR